MHDTRVCLSPEAMWPSRAYVQCYVHAHMLSLTRIHIHRYRRHVYNMSCHIMYTYDVPSVLQDVTHSLRHITCLYTHMVHRQGPFCPLSDHCLLFGLRGCSFLQCFFRPLAPKKVMTSALRTQTTSAPHTSRTRVTQHAQERPAEDMSAPRAGPAGAPS